MNTSQPMSMEVQQFIDSIPLSKIQKIIIFLCFLIVAIDGFDTASIGFLAPTLKEHWALSPTALAPVFAAGLFGLMGGALVFGPMADKYGRKPILLMAVFVFGLGSLLSAASPNIMVLVVLRFITGIGLGGAMPNAITITSEYCPTLRRSTLITLMFCGFTLGSALGGVVTAQLIHLIDWQGIFILGGVLPIIFVPFLYVLLPESLRFLVLTKASANKISKIVLKLTPKGHPTVQLVAPPNVKYNGRIKELFSREYALGTLLIWCAFFMSMLIIYLISSWMPTLLKASGFELSKASWITTVFQIGGTLGSLFLGYLMDKRDAGKVLSASYIAGAIFLVLIGQGLTQGWVWLLILGMFGVGVGISASQVGANAFAANFYPTHCRATGVSWSNAMGRFGSLLGSLIGGWLMMMEFTAAQIMWLLAVPAVIAAVAFSLFVYLHKRRKH